MTLADLRAALDARLATVPGLPAVAKENNIFEPTLGSSFVASAMRPGLRDLLTYPAQNGYVVSEGLFLVDIKIPLGKGPGTADTLAQSILESFAPGTTLTAAGTPVLILRSLARGGFRDEGWWVVPTEIGWHAKTVNTLT